MIILLLKNMIDWCLWVDENLFEGKVVVVVLVLLGVLGGIWLLKMV